MRTMLCGREAGQEVWDSLTPAEVKVVASEFVGASWPI
jgi:hypothetical protein